MAIHTALYAKKLYSPDLFERVKYRSFTARRSRHPGLNAYIGTTVSKLKVSACPLRACPPCAVMRELTSHACMRSCTCQALAKSRALQEVCVVFFDARGRPLERVTFDVKLAAELQNQVDAAALESGFTSSLLSISCSESLSRPLPPGRRRG